MSEAKGNLSVYGYCGTVVERRLARPYRLISWISSYVRTFQALYPINDQEAISLESERANLRVWGSRLA